MKVKIICRKHGVFLQKPRDYLTATSGCPACMWKNESEVGELLKENFTDFDIIPTQESNKFDNPTGEAEALEEGRTW